jgi:lysozyme family protein
MSARNYGPSLALVLAHEGGYTDNPRDPGGPTNKGITQRVYDSYRSNRGVNQQSVKLITASEVSQIYQTNYWRLVRGDSMPDGLDYALFDFAVNSGVGRAVEFLQELVGVTPDRVIGDMTLNAVLTACRNDNCIKLITNLCDKRMKYLEGLSTFATFGKGWTTRVQGHELGAQDNDNGVIDYAIKLAKRVPVYKLPVVSEPSAKAYPLPVGA